VKGSVQEKVKFSPDVVRSSERFTRAAPSTSGRGKSIKSDNNGRTLVGVRLSFMRSQVYVALLQVPLLDIQLLSWRKQGASRRKGQAEDRMPPLRRELGKVAENLILT
jgi:hypothetical protein